MKTLEYYRKQCLKQQTELRRVMASFNQHDKAIRLFLDQHAMLHSAKITPTKLWSFEDAILDDLNVEQMRCIPPKDGHSIAWLIWHIARCEDITMNLLVANSPQVLRKGKWLRRMKITACDTGNAMNKADIAEFSRTVDCVALRAYRVAVGRRTREIIKRLEPAQLRQKIEPARMRRVMDEGAVVPAAHGIADYWASRNIAGLLLMPATRHNLIHLNEALRLKMQLV
jgi:hypothetical protein